VLKKTVQYEDYNGEAVKEDLYFNLSKAELVQLEMSYPGGLSNHLRKIGESEDGPEIIKMFTELLKASYGKRSPDGKRFIKNDQVWEEFVSSEAYSAFFMDLISDPQRQIEFVRGIIPADLPVDVAAMVEQAQTPTAVPPSVDAGARKLTRAEMIEMDGDELRSGLATGRYVIGDE
jgi:hypothetical protein